MEEETLTQIYHQRSQETLRIWRDPTTAKAYSGFYPENLKAIATGIQPALTQPISTLLAELREQVLDDPLADIMQPDHFHLTFLAITPSCYDHRHQPEGVEGVNANCRGALPGKSAYRPRAAAGGFA